MIHIIHKGITHSDILPSWYEPSFVVCLHHIKTYSGELIEELNFVAVLFLMPDSQKSCHWYSQSVVAALPRLPLLSELHTVFFTTFSHMPLPLIAPLFSVLLGVFFLFSFFLSFFILFYLFIYKY